jgi:hypothetical protein
LGNAQKRWIVLVNKTPRGPLSEVEVRAMLVQGVLRHNDLAYCISSETSREKADWKLLWQFHEFDRRTPEAIAAAKAKGIEPRPPTEKREPVDPTELANQAKAELPEDLVDIAPEDLLPRSRSMTTGGMDAVRWEDPTGDKASGASPDLSLPSISLPRWSYGVAAAIFLVFGIVRWITSPRSKPNLSLPLPGDQNATPPRETARDKDDSSLRAPTPTHIRSAVPTPMDASLRSLPPAPRDSMTPVPDSGNLNHDLNHDTRDADVGRDREERRDDQREPADESTPPEDRHFDERRDERDERPDTGRPLGKPNDLRRFPWPVEPKRDSDRHPSAGDNEEPAPEPFSDGPPGAVRESGDRD